MMFQVRRKLNYGTCKQKPSDSIRRQHLNLKWTKAVISRILAAG